jgi:hypothetical protein
MTDHRLFPGCLRALAGFAALAAVLALSACGGGSGAPNNPYAPGPSTPGPLTLLPDTATVYSGIPTTLTVDGGQAPYLAFSSDSAVLPVTQAVPGNSILLLASNVGADTAVTISVQDATLKKVSSTITVKAAPLLPNGITITPNGDCAIGAATLCSGGTGIASVIVTAPGGGGIPGRQVRFDVVAGAYQLQTANPAVPLAATLNVITDSNGQATAGIAVNVNAPTQIASIRATDVTSGNQVTGQFLIQQVTDGSQVLSVIPSDETTITGPDANTCSTGVSVVYHIYGGTPPYQVSAPFAGAVSLSGVPVATNGGSFTATTTGACFDKMPFAITDSTGRTIPSGSSPTLTNAKGTSGGGGTPAALSVSPSSVTTAPNACTGKTFPFVIVGGTPPFNIVLAAPGVANPSPVTTTPGTFNVTGLLDASGVHTIGIGDASSPQLTATATIDCK